MSDDKCKCGHSANVHVYPYGCGICDCGEYEDES